jgi:hypothetical protein
MRFGDKTKKFKSISGSSPIFALSNYTTFSQTQIGATVPLKYVGAFPKVSPQHFTRCPEGLQHSLGNLYLVSSTL